MTIAEAKEQIKNAMTAYFTKDEFGQYRIPVEKQRPVFMIGPPGVGLVSYSMTHHTRQSALGLPYITTKEYGGREYQVSEYTMSEIIGSVYELMRRTGIKEGILFLDEINCISETLAPCMLQFLQYKVFGQHSVPAGWIVVTAGNPPEYNKSVRDFDIVTWDRLKRIDVEPDYEAWKDYAYKKGVHPAVMTYLSARKKDFYKVESTVDGKNFVTARGWDDLSEMIFLYEQNGIAVDEKLIGQYLQDGKIARDFAIYYDLFNKYRSDYQIEAILDGSVSEGIIFRAQQARLDERLSLLGLVFDAVTARLRAVCQAEDVTDALHGTLMRLKTELTTDSDAPELLEALAEEKRTELENGKRASSVSQPKQKTLMKVIAWLEESKAQVLKSSGADALSLIKARFAAGVETFKAQADEARSSLENAFRFCEKAFTEGDEILIFVTELTVNYYSARFIGHYGCDSYYMHNRELQFNERQKEITARIDAIDWEL